MILTMKSYWTQNLALILAGLISLPAYAEVIPGRWEKVSDLDFGTPITAELKNGDRVEGELEGLSESEVDIETRSARAVIPKVDIQTITTGAQGGGGNGAEVGATVGAAVGAAVGAGVSFIGIATSGTVEASGGQLLVGTLITIGLTTAIGAGIGAASDAGTKSETIVVYEAPQ